MLRGRRACRATSPFSLPRAYLIGRPAVCCGIWCCLFVRVSCRSPDSTSPTRTTCGQVASIFIASSSDTSDTRMLRGCCHWWSRTEVTDRPRYRITTPTRAGLRRCTWHRWRHAARLAALARSWWRDRIIVLLRLSVSTQPYNRNPVLILILTYDLDFQSQTISENIAIFRF